MIYLQLCLGLIFVLIFTFILSENRKNILLKNILLGLSVQFFLALIMLKIPSIQNILASLNKFIILLQDVSQEAAVFMFGFLAGGPEPFAVLSPENNFIIAFRVLPLIIVISAFSAVLFHLRILPFIINLIARLLMKTMGLSGPLAFGAGSSLFLGTIETPLAIRPYLEKMTRGELLALLCCSMSTVSGTVMALYANVLKDVVPNPIGHMIIASFVSIPAALMLSNMLVPFQVPRKSKLVKFKRETTGVMDAMIQGTSEGLQMVLSIVAVIIVMFSFVYLGNRCVSFAFSEAFSINTLAELFSFFFAPLMWILGISWEHSLEAGKLMSTKIFLNEFVAYLDLAKSSSLFSIREKMLLSYAFCNFANFASVGIILGGLSAILPKRRQELVSLSWKSLIIGNLASMMTACMIGFLI